MRLEKPRAGRPRRERGASSTSRLWLLACGSSALILATTVGLLLSKRPPPAPRVAEATAGCNVAPLDFEGDAPGGDPPVVLWAEAPTRLFLDGAPVFSAPEAPRHFAPGAHLLRVEAPDREAYEARIHLEPWQPALIHAALDPAAGITVVRMGAACASCPAALGEEPLGFEASPASARPALMLEHAAHALRQSRRAEAVQALKHVPPASRKGPLYARLAAQIFHDTFQAAAARRILGLLEREQAGELPTLLEVHQRLERSEATRRREVHLARWNRLTERFNAVIERFGARHPGPTDGASQRLAALSVAFEAGDLEAVAAGENTLSQLVEQLKSLKPGDCAFHSEVVAAAGG